MTTSNVRIGRVYDESNDHHTMRVLVDRLYVAFDGILMTGRDEIAAGHRPLFGGIMKGSRLAVVERHVRFPDPGTAIVVQRAGIIMRWQKGRTTPSRKRLSTNTTILAPKEPPGQWPRSRTPVTAPERRPSWVAS